MFDETQAAFGDTAAFDEAKKELSVSQPISRYLRRITEGDFNLLTG